MPGATRSIVINAPVEKAFEVITDYDKYAEFLPEVKKVRVSDRQGNSCQIHYEVDVIKTIKYTIKMVEEKPKRISWTFVNGEFMKDNKGAWTLEATADGKTQATYSVEMALGPLVPKSIVNALVDTSLPKMLEAFKKRIESR